MKHVGQYAVYFLWLSILKDNVSPRCKVDFIYDELGKLAGSSLNSENSKRKKQHERCFFTLYLIISHPSTLVCVNLASPLILMAKTKFTPSTPLV
ncbi:hypothetical protein BM527_08300 [Alteromonas sp. Mex14]|nr:hypothetical protein BM527_08300 [Alteromonas sp. Mex14]